MGNFVKVMQKSIINNKYKLILLSGCSLTLYLIYRKYLKENIQMMTEIYNQMKDFESLSGNKNPSDKVSKFLEGAGATNLILKLLDEVKANLVSSFHLDDLFEKIQNSPKQQIQSLWVIFKNLSLIEFYCSTFITRVLLIVTQTEFLIIERMKLKNQNSSINTYYDIYNSLLIELWSLSKDYIKHVLTSIETQLSDVTKDIILQSKYDFKTFIGFLERFRRKIEFVIFDNASNEFYMNTMKFFFNEVEKKIESLENNEYTVGEDSFKVEIHLEFYNNFYDIITSNLFQTVLINGLDYDFKILFDMIEINFDNQAELSIPKIVSFVVKIKNQILDKNNSIFLLKNYKSNCFNEEMKEFLNIIY
jgi:hypothetical protein